MKKRIFLFSVAILLALNFFVWQEVFALSGPHYLEVDFLNVGQGDSEFIETPGGHQILIDGGPTSAVLEKLAQRMPFFDKSIDLVILTHPEKDHMMGLLDVLQRYKVDYFLWNGIVKNDTENKKLAELLNNAQNTKQNFLLASLNIPPVKTKVLIAQAGQEIRAGSVLIDTLFPLENFEGKELKNTSNDTCVVSKIIYGKNSFLFTGDIDSAAESDLVKSDLTNLKADVLKAAHHGSKYSTSDLFLENVKPKIAVIEVGKNSYGHPTNEVLQRLNNYGIKIFRTDINGDVELESDGNNIKINKN